MLFSMWYNLLTAKNLLTLINLCNFYKPCKSYAILCMLDATFGAWWWPELNWCNMYQMLCFCKQIVKRIINDCYCNFLCLDFPPWKCSSLLLFFILNFSLFFLTKFLLIKKMYNSLGSYNVGITMTELIKPISTSMEF